MSLRFRHPAGLGYDWRRGAFSRPIAIEVRRNPRIRAQTIGRALCVGTALGMAEAAKPARVEPLRGRIACQRVEAQNRGQHPLGPRKKDRRDSRSRPRRLSSAVRRNAAGYRVTGGPPCSTSTAGGEASPWQTEKLRNNAPASGRWQAEACPTNAAQLLTRAARTGTARAKS